MNREQALAKANEVVGEWLDAPKNQRGYPVDGWKPTSPTERADIVVKLAEFLCEPDQPSRLVAPAEAGSVFGATVFGWPVDGSRKPTEAEYQFALDARSRIGPNGMVTAAEAHALAALIAAYEQPEGA